MSRVEQLKELQSSLKAKLAEGKSKLSLINEEQTKQFYILRLLGLLGYDSTVEGEIVPEAPVNAGDRIDYLLRVNNEEVAIIECKKLGHVLNAKDIAQLQRYYTDKVKVKLAILTNGDDYLLFTDTQEINVMDKVPYKSFKVSSLTDYSAFDELAKENISSIYIPYKENVISQGKAALEQELKQNKKELKAMTDKLAVLENKVYLTEAQKQEQLEMKAKALRLENENKSLKNRLNVVKACSPVRQDRVSPKVTYGTAFDKQEVPSNIAKDMVDMIPDDLLVPESTFMDICCRYGEFLIAIQNRLMEAPAMIKAFPDEIDRRDHITQNQLYALMPDEKGLKEVTKTLFRTSNVGKSNIIAFKDIKEYSRAINVYKELKYVNGDILTKSERQILEKLGDMMYMKFDVVVSNPPYNNDQYIDFVNLGDEMATDCSIYISPAKWQSKGGKKNEQFRQDIVPRMKEIAYYSDSKDIFGEIGLAGGVSTYYVDKKIHKDKVVNDVMIQDFDIDFPLDITEGELALVNKIRQVSPKCLLEKFSPKLSYNTILSFSGDHYKADMIQPGSGYYLMDNTKKVEIDKKYIKDLDRAELWQTVHGPYSNRCCTAMLYKPHEIAPSYYITLFAGDYDSVRSADSYFKCKLVWWLVVRFFGGSGLSTRSFKFVPDPGAFDHIFTDDELYKKYNLTQDEINIIESVIKERKSK